MARRRGGHARVSRRVAAALAALFWPALASAEVETDGTLGARIRLTGRDVEVPARLGRVRGKNLFHSFERFGVPTKGQVTFTGPGGLKNVIGRVTGGARSEINGTLASRVPGADLYLLNPAGVLFGPDAKLDVPGSFHVSTADELRFADGAVFSALDLKGSTLSVAPPQAFGFLGAKPPGPISVNQSVLEVREGKALSLIGGDLTITGGGSGAASGGDAGTVRAEAGRIALTAMGGAGAVTVATGEVGGADSAAVRLTDQALVDTSGDGGGTVRIRGGRVVVEDQSFVFADNTGATDAPRGIAIEAGAVAVAAASRITSDALGTGKAGTVTVVAGELEVRDRSEIRSHASLDSANAGDAGAVTVRAGAVELRDGGQINASTFGPGDAGAVTVTAAGRLTVAGDVAVPVPAGIFSQANPGSTGDAGAVTVRAGAVELRGRGAISSSTFGPGNAGAVAVAASGGLAILGDDAAPYEAGITSQTIPSSAGPTGDAGRVRVTAGTVELRGSGQINSSTRGPGDAGAVTVTAAGRLTVAGDPSSSGITNIASQAISGSTGDAGAVTVRAGAVELRGRGAISSSTFGPGDAGAVAVAASGGLAILGDDAAPYEAGITSQAFPGLTDDAGDAGRVTVRAGTVLLRDTGVISSSTFGAGDAGEVAIIAADRLTVAGGGEVETNSVSGGAAGDVAVRASRLAVRDGGLIGSSGLGSGPAGDLRVDAGTLAVEEASIRTEGTGAAGGRIFVDASDLIHLKEAEVTSSGIEPGEGSSVITLESPLIVLDASRVTSLTGEGQPLEGSGLAQLLGDVTVISPDSFVAASSAVSVLGLENEVGSRLAVPPGVFLDAGNLLRERCAARGRGVAGPSSFTAVGRGGLPPDPAGPLVAPYREPGTGGSSTVSKAAARERSAAGPALRAADTGCEPDPGG